MCADAESKPTIGPVVEGRLRLYCFLSMQKKYRQPSHGLYWYTYEFTRRLIPDVVRTVRRPEPSKPLLSSPHVTGREDDCSFPRYDILSGSTTTLGVHFTRRQPVFEKGRFGTLLFPVSSGRNYLCVGSRTLLCEN